MSSQDGVVHAPLDPRNYTDLTVPLSSGHIVISDQIPRSQYNTKPGEQHGGNKSMNNVSNASYTIDALAPPETTRPTPNHGLWLQPVSPPTRNNSGRPEYSILDQAQQQPDSPLKLFQQYNQQELMTPHQSPVWQRSPIDDTVSTGCETNRIPREGLIDLSMIMAEQAEDKRQKERIAEEECRLAEAVAQQAQEEEFIRLAMEMSLTEDSSNNKTNIFNYNDEEYENTQNSSTRSNNDGPISLQQQVVLHDSNEAACISKSVHIVEEFHDTFPHQQQNALLAMEQENGPDVGNADKIHHDTLAFSISSSSSSSVENVDLIMDDFDDGSSIPQDHWETNMTQQQKILLKQDHRQQHPNAQLFPLAHGEKFDGRAAVLEMARLYLDPDEYQSINEALLKCAMNRSSSNVLEQGVDFDCNRNISDNARLPVETSQQDRDVQNDYNSFVSAFAAAVANNKMLGESPDRRTDFDENRLKDALQYLSPNELQRIGQLLSSKQGILSSSVSPSGHANSTRSNNVPKTYADVSRGNVATGQKPEASGIATPLHGGQLRDDELLAIQLALGDSEPSAYNKFSSNAFHSTLHATPASDHGRTIDAETFPFESPISAEEAAVIMKALRDADEIEERRSLELALRLQENERLLLASAPRIVAINRQINQGNVRIMTRQELEIERRIATDAPTRGSYDRARSQRLSDYGNGRYDDPDYEEFELPEKAFRMNAQTTNNGGQSVSRWSRIDNNSIIGPNNEVRTKHDDAVSGLANLERLGLESEDDFPKVGNTAFNSFRQSFSKKTKKGVETHGSGRAGSDSDATKGGVLDPHVRAVISKAINNEMIEHCNGIVKEGKEAVIYHADKGKLSNGFDVAIKVFKRIQEFRSRGNYVDGDPRFGKNLFKNIGGREQVELWTEKEYRNLVRANRAGVPVPSPLFHKENVLFMRFLGANGWPAPQLKEIDLRHGSSRWETLYRQILDGVKRLYHNGHLVHGDLSEYNVMVVPQVLVENKSSSIEQDELQAVFIDFAQAVDTHHPDSLPLLNRDLDRILTFFKRQGLVSMSTEDAISFVLNSESQNVEMS